MADDPDESTSTTCGAVTPDGTLHVAAGALLVVELGVRRGFGVFVGAGRAVGRAVGRTEVGVALRVVVVAGRDLVDVAEVVEAVVVAVEVVVVVVAGTRMDDGAVIEGLTVGGAACCASSPHAARARVTSTAVEASAARRVRRVALIGRSAGSRGCSTGRPSAGPGW